MPDAIARDEFRRVVRIDVRDDAEDPLAVHGEAGGYAAEQTALRTEHDAAAQHLGMTVVVVTDSTRTGDCMMRRCVFPNGGLVMTRADAMTQCRAATVSARSRR